MRGLRRGRFGIALVDDLPVTDHQQRIGANARALDVIAFREGVLFELGQRGPYDVIIDDASHNPDKPTSKAWAYGRFECPAITYEDGDKTDRDFIRRQATVAAEEMMRLLLEYVRP